MGFLEKLFNVIGAIYSAPFNQYHYEYWGEEGGRDWISTIILGLIIYGLSIIIGAIMLYVIFSRIHWYRKRRMCQHNDCGRWTLETSDGSDPSCLADNACCTICALQHEYDSAVRRADSEEVHQCLECQTSMRKEIVGNPDFGWVVIDKCPSCSSTFFSKRELELLQEMAREEGYEEGEDDGFSSGLIIGIAAGIST